MSLSLASSDRVARSAIPSLVVPKLEYVVRGLLDKSLTFCWYGRCEFDRIFSEVIARSGHVARHLSLGALSPVLAQASTE